MRLQQYTGCEWNVKTKTYLHSSLSYGNLPFLIKLFLSNHFTIKNRFRKVTSVSVRILFHDLVSEPVQVTVLFPSSPETHGTQLHNIQATFLIQGLFQKVSIERALSMILAFLARSFYYFWWFAYLQFGEIGLSRDQWHDKFVQCRQRESRLRWLNTVLAVCECM